jgi:hypothetical protein
MGAGSAIRIVPPQSPVEDPPPPRDVMGATQVNATTAPTLLVVVLREFGVWFTAGDEEPLAVSGDAEGSPGRLREGARRRNRQGNPRTTTED